MLEVEGLRVHLGETDLRYDLSVETGSCHALLGASGAGKSTLVALIAGFLDPLAGRIRFDGKDIADLPPHRRPVATLFQERNLFPHLSVWDNVALGADPGLRLDGSQRGLVDAALSRAELAHLARRLPGEISGGERQRAALARTLVQRRPLLALDEPFAALGPALRLEMLDFVDSIRRRERCTVLLVSHLPGDARRIASRASFLHEGKILCEAPVAKMLDDPPWTEVRHYLGLPAGMVGGERIELPSFRV